MMPVFVIECGVGSVIINGFNQPLVFGSEQSAHDYIELVVEQNPGNARNASLRVVECYSPDGAFQRDVDIAPFLANDYEVN